MIAVLAIVACLDQLPSRCEKFEIILEPFQCHLPVSAYLAAMSWANENPDWTLKRIITCKKGMDT